MVTLQDRKAGVLGGTSGIGLATATLLTDRGADVTIGGRDERRLGEAADSLPRGPKTIAVDATEPKSNGVTGRYFNGSRPAEPHPQAQDRDARQRLHRLSDQLCANGQRSATR